MHCLKKVYIPSLPPLLSHLQMMRRVMSLVDISLLKLDKETIRVNRKKIKIEVRWKHKRRQLIIQKRGVYPELSLNQRYVYFMLGIWRGCVISACTKDTKYKFQGCKFSTKRWISAENRNPLRIYFPKSWESLCRKGALIIS